MINRLPLDWRVSSKNDWVGPYTAAMRFLPPPACDSWILALPQLSPPVQKLSVQLPSEPGRLLHLARTIATEITFRQPCLLRVTEWNIWHSSNNWHLYYRLRQSYQDYAVIDEAPGHLFLDHEAEDLVTFLHVAMLFGWDAKLQPQAPYFSAELSHDGFIDVSSDGSRQLEDLQKLFGELRTRAD